MFYFYYLLMFLFSIAFSMFVYKINKRKNFSFVTLLSFIFVVSSFWLLFLFSNADIFGLLLLFCALFFLATVNIISHWSLKKISSNRTYSMVKFLTLYINICSIILSIFLIYDVINRLYRV